MHPVKSEAGDYGWASGLMEMSETTAPTAIHVRMVRASFGTRETAGGRPRPPAAQRSLKALAAAASPILPRSEAASDAGWGVR